MTSPSSPQDKCDDADVMRIWRECGLPEYFLGNGGTNHKLVAFAKACATSPAGGGRGSEEDNTSGTVAPPLPSVAGSPDAADEWMASALPDLIEEAVDRLSRGFIYSLTPEGREYWWAIHQRLHDMAAQKRADLATKQDAAVAGEVCPGDGKPCYVGGVDDAHHRCGTVQCGRPSPNPWREMARELAGALRELLNCAEIADCAPEDKEPETHDSERRARDALSALNALSTKQDADVAGEDGSGSEQRERVATTMALEEAAKVIDARVVELLGQESDHRLHGRWSNAATVGGYIYELRQNAKAVRALKPLPLPPAG